MIRTLAERAALEAEQSRIISRALLEAEPSARMGTAPRSAPGDKTAQRRIPLMAPGGLGGVIPGTHPEREAMRRCRR